MTSSPVDGSFSCGGVFHSGKEAYHNWVKGLDWMVARETLLWYRAPTRALLPEYGARLVYF